jgi:membrane associated rhomboid family serine protease
VADNLFPDGDPPADACQALNAERSSYLTLVTSQFLHGDWLHLIFNMLFLWVFGNNIEDRLGRIRFLPFYLLCGAIAGVAQSAADGDSPVPLIGASGAISGVLGAYLVLYPRIRVWSIVLPLFFLPFRLPAWVWLAIYLVLQIIYLGDSAGGGDVAYLAHIGGFVAGAALIKPFLIGRNDPPPRTPAIGRVY